MDEDEDSVHEFLSYIHVEIFLGHIPLKWVPLKPVH